MHNLRFLLFFASSFSFHPTTCVWFMLMFLAFFTVRLLPSPFCFSLLFLVWFLWPFIVQYSSQDSSLQFPYKKMNKKRQKEGGGEWREYFNIQAYPIGINMYVHACMHLWGLSFNELFNPQFIKLISMLRF